MELGDVIFVIFLTENLISGWTKNISYTFASRWEFFGQKVFFFWFKIFRKSCCGPLLFKQQCACVSWEVRRGLKGQLFCLSVVLMEMCPTGYTDVTLWTWATLLLITLRCSPDGLVVPQQLARFKAIKSVKKKKSSDVFPTGNTG